MKKIGNRPITEADTDFSKLQKMPTICTLYLLFEENDTFCTQTVLSVHPER